MKRFYFDNADDEGEPEDDEFDVPEMEFLTMGSGINPDHYLLSCAIRVCEKSFFWFFLGASSRLSMLESTYKTIKKMTEEGEDDAQV